jgi:bifunctional DNA-binding transcriptional regulator/antitoxin component of YhaV-PrlF toxin-antitoxin module
LPGKYVKTKYIIVSTGNNSIIEEDNDNYGYIEGEFIESNEIREFCDIYYDSDKKCDVLEFGRMNEIMVIVVKSKYEEYVRECKDKLKKELSELNGEEVKRKLEKLSGSEMNYVLFECEEEQMDRCEDKRGYYL